MSILSFRSSLLMICGDIHAYSTVLFSNLLGSLSTPARQTQTAKVLDKGDTAVQSELFFVLIDTYSLSSSLSTMWIA